MIFSLSRTLFSDWFAWNFSWNLNLKHIALEIVNLSSLSCEEERREIFPVEHMGDKHSSQSNLILCNCLLILRSVLIWNRPGFTIHTDMRCMTCLDQLKALELEKIQVITQHKPQRRFDWGYNNISFNFN